MSYTIHEDHQNLQICPKCGKAALAQPRENLYRCLWCRFESDISEASFRFPSFILLIVFVVILIIFLQG